MADDQRTFRATVEDDASGSLNDIKAAFEQLRQEIDNLADPAERLSGAIADNTYGMEAFSSELENSASAAETLSGSAEGASGSVEHLGESAHGSAEAHGEAGHAAEEHGLELDRLVESAASASQGMNALKGSLLGVVEELGPLGILAAAGAEGLLKLGEQVAEGANAVISEEASLTRLSQALKSNAKDWDGTTTAVKAAAEAGKQYGFDEAQTYDALSRLVAVTGSEEKALRALDVAQNMAAGTGMDLQTAANLLGRAMENGGAGLSRYGIIVQKHSTDMQVLDQVYEHFKGQAQAMADTVEGGGKRAALAIDDLKKSLGASMVPGMEATASSVEKFSKDLTENQDTLKGEKEAIGGLMGVFSQFVGGALNELEQGLTSLGALLNDPLNVNIGLVNGKLQITSKAADDAAVSIGNLKKSDEEGSQSLKDFADQNGTTAAAIITHYNQIADAAEDRGHAAAVGFKQPVEQGMSDTESSVSSWMSNIKSDLNIAPDAQTTGQDDADAWKYGLLAGLSKAEIEAGIEVEKIAKYAMDAKKNMGIAGWNNAVAFLQQMTAALERGLPLIAGYISNFVASINKQLPGGAELPIVSIATGGVPMLPSQIASGGGGHSGGSGGSGRHGGSGGSGPSAQQIAQQQQQAAQTLQQVANEEALAKAKDQTTAAQKALDDVTERYGIILGEIDNKIKAVKDEEASRLAGLQGQIDPLNNKLAQLKVASEGALARFDEQIKGADTTLKSLEVTARQALDPFIEKAKEATDALDALKHAGQMMDESFTHSLNNIQEQMYELDQSFQGPMRALGALAQNVQDQIDATTRAEDAALHPLDEAIRSKQIALQAEQNAIQDLTAHYDGLLKPLQERLSLLQQTNQANQQAQQLAQADQGITNLQERLANAGAGSAEAQQLQRQLGQATAARANQAEQFSLQDQIAAIDRQKQEQLTAANERLAQHQRELQALQREREEVQHTYEEQLRALNLQKQAIDAQMQALQRSHDARMQQLQDEQTQMQHTQTLFDQQQRDREEAAQRNVDDANRELTAQQNAWNQEIQQQKDLIAGLQAMRQTRQEEDAAAEKAVTDQIASLKTIYDAVKTNYDNQVTQLDNTKQKWTDAENAEKAYNQSILDKAKDVQDAIQGYVDKTNAAAHETDALQKYADAFKVSIGQAKDVLNQDMTPAMSAFKRDGLQPVADMHNPDINGSLGYYMLNWDPENRNGYRTNVATSIHGVGDAMTALLPLQEDRWKTYFSVVGGGFTDLINKMGQFNNAVAGLGTPGSGSGSGTSGTPASGPHGPSMMATGGGGGGTTAYAPMFIGSQTNYYTVSVSVDQALMPGEVPADPRAWRPAARAIAVALAEVRS